METPVIASQRVRAKRGPMTGSAKQSRAAGGTLDCSGANAPRNDGLRHGGGDCIGTGGNGRGSTRQRPAFRPATSQ